LHFTVICCTNKCIINERYIPEHQNKLNIYDLQNTTGGRQAREEVTGKSVKSRIVTM